MSLKEVKAANNHPTSQPFLEALQLVNVGVSFPYCVRSAPLPCLCDVYTAAHPPPAEVRAVETRALGLKCDTGRV